MRGRTYASITVVRRALVLAVLAGDAVRERDLALEAELSQRRFRGELVRRIRVGVHERRPRRRSTPSAWKTSSAARDVVLHDRRPDLAVRAASRSVTGKRSRRGRAARGWCQKRSYGIAAVAASDLEHVAEAACREQADDGARAGEERVEADGRAVQEVARDAQSRSAGTDAATAASTPLFGRSRCRRLLPDADLAASRRRRRSDR